MRILFFLVLEAVTAHVQKQVDADRFSGVVLVAKDGQVQLTRAYGQGNTPDTAFNVGSINKEFTKAAVEQLAQAGKLSLDDTVEKHLPGSAITGADRITIRQLLEHRSGLGDFFGPKYDAAPPSRLRELRDFVPLFASEPLAFAPGTGKRYSNAGYLVLGLIIEKLSGETYRDYVTRHIFAPAKMTHSGFWAVDEQVAHRATGYTREGEARVPNTRHLPGRPSSAGGTFCTAGDLLRFFETRPMGIAVAGGAPGINAAVEREDGWTVIVLSNYDPPSATDLAREVMGLLGVRRPPSGPEKIELSGDVAVPMTMAGHLATVETKINGKGPFRFAVDTGAGGMLRVSEEVKQALQLPQIGEVRAADPSGKNPERRAVVRVDTVEIGGARLSGVHASVGAGRGPDSGDGVIGLALFGKLTVTLDYPGKQLRLANRPLEGGIPFTSPRGVPVIDIDAAGVPLEVDVDSGSPALLTIPASWQAKLPFTAPPRVVGKGRTVSNEFEIRAADLRGDLRVAGQTQASPRVDVVDVFPVGNLGSRFLRGYAVTFDLANRRMALLRRGGVSAGSAR